MLTPTHAATAGAEAGTLPPGYRLAAAVVGRAGGGAFSAFLADGREGAAVWAAAALPGVPAGPLGDWRAAFGRCRAARLQPLVLLYAAA
jgi:hypothetical protein